MGEIELDLESLPDRTFKAGDVIIAEGQPFKGLLFLRSGTVSVSKQGIGVQRVSTSGAVFGEMSFLLDSLPKATVTADTPCEMKFVEHRRGFIAENPQAALYIARILAARLDSVVGYLVDIKSQFADHENHFGMIDEILDTIINKHPREIRKDLRELDRVDD